MDVSHSISIDRVENAKNRQCNPRMNKQFDNDWYHRNARQSEKQFGCVIPMYSSIVSTKMNREIEVCQNSTLGYKAMKYYFKKLDVADSDRLVPCAKFDFHLGIPDIDDTNNEMHEAYLKLYLNTDVLIKTTILYYGSVELAAEIGGFVGMILGISLIDIAKLLSFIIDVTIQKKFEK